MGFDWQLLRLAPTGLIQLGRNWVPTGHLFSTSLRQLAWLNQMSCNNIKNGFPVADPPPKGTCGCWNSSINSWRMGGLKRTVIPGGGLVAVEEPRRSRAPRGGEGRWCRGVGEERERWCWVGYPRTLLVDTTSWQPGGHRGQVLLPRDARLFELKWGPVGCAAWGRAQLERALALEALGGGDVR
jgi:hypothetical protein